MRLNLCLRLNPLDMISCDPVTNATQVCVASSDTVCVR
jgi:hypothetical protein